MSVSRFASAALGSRAHVLTQNKRRTADTIKRHRHLRLGGEIVESDLFSLLDIFERAESKLSGLYVAVGLAAVVEILPAIVQIFVCLPDRWKVEVPIASDLNCVLRRLGSNGAFETER